MESALATAGDCSDSVNLGKKKPRTKQRQARSTRRDATKTHLRCHKINVLFTTG
jgi:hypothetical protein